MFFFLFERVYEFLSPKRQKATRLEDSLYIPMTERHHVALFPLCLLLNLLANKTPHTLDNSDKKKAYG